MYADGMGHAFAITSIFGIRIITPTTFVYVSHRHSPGTAVCDCVCDLD